MKAIQCVEWGGPEKLVLADIPRPEPAEGEVRIQVAAAGVNFPDGLIIQKKYQLQPALPFVPGSEVAGVVDAVGPGVEYPQQGDRVIAFIASGAFAEYATAPAARCIPVPKGLSDELAAAFTLAYATAHHALFERGNLKAGETLLVLGAAGGTGLAAVELGKLIGARVIAAASTTEKLEAATAHGADATINYFTTDLREAIKALTAGKGPDVIYDPVGGAYSELAMRSIAWRGRFLVVGFANGTIPSLSLNLPLLKGASIVGVFWGDYAKREPESNRRMISELMAWLVEGKLKPYVSQTYSLAETSLALSTLLARRAVGKLVIKVEARADAKS